MEAVRQAPTCRIWGSTEYSNSGNSAVSRYQTVFFPRGSSSVHGPLFFHPELARVHENLRNAEGYSPIKVITLAPDGEHLRFRGGDRNGNPVEEYGFFDVLPLVTKTVAVENIVDAALFLDKNSHCMSSNCTGAKGDPLELHRSVVFSLVGEYSSLKGFCGKCFDLEFGEPGKLDPLSVLFDGRGLWLHSPVEVISR